MIIQHSNTGQCGTSVWESGIAFSEYIKSHPSLVKGKRILELGSGTGIVGLAAFQSGASHVLLTDIPQIIPLLKQNASLVAMDSEHLKVQVLDWFDFNALDVPPVDMILGADVVYCLQGSHALIQVLHRLSRFSTKIMIAFENRDPIVTDSFLKGMKAAGFKAQTPILKDLVFIYTFKKKRF
jgi:predicted nicotinamide N-methyase